MSRTGAQCLVDALAAHGVQHLFTLSGNQILSIYDATVARDDRVVEALGGHGEYVARPEELAPALARAIASGRPACVNVAIEGVAAPTFKAHVPAH
jgi:thiamine pyrophosphate-dependent acetolactate synthase large subunit-like protein